MVAPLLVKGLRPLRLIELEAAPEVKVVPERLNGDVIFKVFVPEAKTPVDEVYVSKGTFTVILAPVDGLTIASPVPLIDGVGGAATVKLGKNPVTLVEPAG